LSDCYEADCGQCLKLPNDTARAVTINATGYEEEHEMEMEREVSRPPESEEHMRRET